MSTDRGGSQNDGLADMPDDPELLADFRRLLERVRAHAPARDKPVDVTYKLNLDNPPATTDEPLLGTGYALLHQLPEGWDAVFLQVTVAADDVRTIATVLAQEGDSNNGRFYFFSDLDEPILALRRSTYEPDGRGAWYNAQIRLFRDGTLDAIYDFLTPPFGCWGPNEASLVLRDHELYPRAPEQLPHWHPVRWPYELR